MPRGDLIQHRRGTSAQWASVNPVLASGEVGFATDTNEIRVGNGTSPWTGLEPVGGIPAEGISSIQKVTQAEYDALPTPRPGDVLYVIVN